MRRRFGLILVFFLAAAELWGQTYERTDLRDRDRLVILLFGHSGTGKAGQHRVARAMYEICRERDCQFALMLGDNVYENGIQGTGLTAFRAAIRKSWTNSTRSSKRLIEGSKRSKDFAFGPFWAITTIERTTLVRILELWV